MAVLAVQAIRKMRGGAQSQLMLGADGNLWIVKFMNNPQHVRVLANELIATRLAAAIGLTVPETDIIEVTPWLVANTPGMMYELGKGERRPYAHGLHFGSRFVGGLMPGQAVDYLPDQQLDEVRNLREFAGMLAFDKWAGNCNGRQAVFTRNAREKKYRASFIDQGFCFNAGEWTFLDSPLRGIFARNRVYTHVTGWESFQPYLQRIEEIEPSILWEIAESVPPEWYGGNLDDMERLMEQLLSRRSRVRELILSFRNSDRAPFPLWADSSSVPVSRNLTESSGSKDFVM